MKFLGSPYLEFPSHTVKLIPKAKSISLSLGLRGNIIKSRHPAKCGIYHEVIGYPLYCD